MDRSASVCANVGAAANIKQEIVAAFTPTLTACAVIILSQGLLGAALTTRSNACDDQG